MNIHRVSLTCKDLVKNEPRNKRPSVSTPYLFSSQGSLVQVRACMSLSASEAMVVFSYMDQAKFHSFTPPSLIALQYTTDFKFGLIQEPLMRDDKELFEQQEKEKVQGC